MPYSTPQTLGKAVRRAEKNMPHSPRKKVAVLKKLAAKHSCLPFLLSLKRETRIDTHLHDLAKGFYERNDISSYCAGMKDYVTIRVERVNNTYKSDTCS